MAKKDFKIKLTNFVKNVLDVLSIIGRVVILGFFALLSCYGLYWTVNGSTYTNYISLLTKFPDERLVYGMSLAITLGFALPQFFMKKNLLTRFTIGAIIFISSSLAINMFAAKEIRDAESRLRDDIEYQSWEREYSQKLKLYEELNKTVLDQSAKEWETGAKTARIQRDNVKKESDVAFEKMRARAEDLKVKGTVVNEAFVDTWYTLAHNTKLPFMNEITTHGITIGSNLLFSLINDTLILIFCALLRSILGQVIIIPNERKLNESGLLRKFSDKIFGGLFSKRAKTFSKRLVNPGERLVNVYQSSEPFSNGNREKQRRERISEETFSGIKEIISEHNKDRSLNLEEIGRRAAQNIGRNKPFSKGYVSQVLNNWVS